MTENPFSGSRPNGFSQKTWLKSRGGDHSDAVHILLTLFSGQSRDCEDAQDVNDDGNVDISDPVTLLNYLFRAMPHPTSPFPKIGTDPTPDDLGCERL